MRHVFCSTGIGFGLIYVPAVIAVGFYFEKWRAMATGIAVCGSGIGTFVMAPIFASLISALGWKKTLLVQAAMSLCCIAFGVLFRSENNNFLFLFCHYELLLFAGL